MGTVDFGYVELKLPECYVAYLAESSEILGIRNVDNWLHVIHNVFTTIVTFNPHNSFWRKIGHCYSHFTAEENRCQNELAKFT